jgi:outer membrane receptor for ferrienterochelin and colicin
MTLNTLSLGYDIQRTFRNNHNVLAGVVYGMETARNASGVPFLVNETVNWEPTVSAPIQYEWRITQNNHLYLGGLFSHHYVSGSHFAPMLAYIHKFNDKHALRLAMYTSYRNPNVFEHSIDYDQTTGKSGKQTRIVSNRNLEAERTVSLELGFRSEPKEKVFFSTDFYLSRITNGIEWSLVGVDQQPAPRPRYRSENSLEQLIGGLELAVRYDFSRHFNIENNLSFTSVSNDSSKPEYQGTLLRGPNHLGEGRYGATYVPPYIYNAIAHFTWRKSQINLYYQYTAAHTWQWPKWSAATGQDVLEVKPVPGYDTLNAYVSIDAFKYLTLAFEGYNLLDNRHTEWRGDESYFGRELWGKIILRY